ncbi:NAD(P)-dependent dehydrogenase (short-subunit alcohol dehydrogenase family) [Actinoalloteichus hoggarensis]|uniref:Cyclopentanol dehydrogenase n=1 Tax=Actinoalloteichus hoggarensis TaxID=1470176 RepID=A0A221WAY2_9PSEU|nr:SDR family oxidoreductase [Actinoalloteichus hoggarensis]ASO23142.1 Cyclopentanol dehydrogenase [Actinoalloteichus hoggarensis]MBB5922746.1 NAD(P)-dependent dehydrogenase (short-subunit alcohol dehydrogenase family) [Actinoalloteichus hoggarensis]
MVKTTALVTGANKGLGREAVRRLAGLGWTVFLGARDAERGTEAARALAKEGLDVRFVELDVRSDESVAAAAKTVFTEAGSLDVLVNNAGIGGPGLAPADTGADELREVFEVNTFGPVRVMRSFLPLLRAAEQPRVVMVSSGMGSFGVAEDPRHAGIVPPQLGYPASKTALNMITVQYAHAMDDIRINAVDPGYTATDLNGHTGFQSLTEGTDAIVRLACVDADGPTGGFFDRHGKAAW